MAALAVVGLHLSGEQRNAELVDAGGVLQESTTTAPDYRLFRLADRSPALPGLLRVAHGGGPIAVEVWDVPLVGLAALLGVLPAPLSLGCVRLADGREVLGFLCEAYATTEATDLTRFGGWRAAQSFAQLRK